MTKFVEEGGYKELLPITTECRGENTVSRYALTKVNDEVPVGRRPLIPPVFKVVEESGLSRDIWDIDYGGSNPPHLTKFVSYILDNKKIYRV